MLREPHAPVVAARQTTSPTAANVRLGSFTGSPMIAAIRRAGFDTGAPVDYLLEHAETRPAADRGGYAPGHSRCARPQDAGARAGARAHHRPRDRASFRRCS